MKYTLFSFLFIGLFFGNIQAQSINFAAINQKQSNIVYASFGLNFGMTTSLGFARTFNLGHRQLLVSADYTFPIGKTLFDDFRIRMGAQIEIYTLQHFKLAGKLFAHYKTVDNNIYTANTFGTETGLLIGYYKPHWYIAGEFGFDLSIATFLQQTDWYLTLYPEAQSKWYAPIGGNFYYGLQGGYSFWNMDIIIRVGMVNNQQFKPTLLPFYGQLEVHYKF